jgi:HrpA-like RNA helicase
LDKLGGDSDSVGSGDELETAIDPTKNNNKEALQVLRAKARAREGGGGGADSSAPSSGIGDAQAQATALAQAQARAEATSKRLKNDLARKKAMPKYQEIFAVRNQLPTLVMKDKVLETIRNNRVTVISGSTGCGKTTQVIHTHTHSSVIFVFPFSFNPLHPPPTSKPTPADSAAGAG